MNTDDTDQIRCSQLGSLNYQNYLAVTQVEKNIQRNENCEPCLVHEVREIKNCSRYSNLPRTLWIYWSVSVWTQTSKRHSSTWEPLPFLPPRNPLHLPFLSHSHRDSIAQVSRKERTEMPTVSHLWAHGCKIFSTCLFSHSFNPVFQERTAKHWGVSDRKRTLEIRGFILSLTNITTQFEVNSCYSAQKPAAHQHWGQRFFTFMQLISSLGTWKLYLFLHVFSWKKKELPCARVCGRSSFWRIYNLYRAKKGTSFRAASAKKEEHLQRQLKACGDRDGLWACISRICPGKPHASVGTHFYHWTSTA